jgi:hypothetical protein
MAGEHSQSRGRMTKELWIAAALDAGSTPERAERQWGGKRVRVEAHVPGER